MKLPLETIIKHFSTEDIEITYGNVLISLKALSVENQTVVILLRMVDLIQCDKGGIDEGLLRENLQALIEQMDVVKKQRSISILVALCPSVVKSPADESILLAAEEYFSQAINARSFSLITLLDIQQYYLIKTFNNSVGENVHIPYSPDFYVGLACLLARKLHSMLKKISYKVIVVDCDNTLWTGVAGELDANGVEFKKHNLLLQKFLVEQHETGMLICLCSKNDAQIVSDVFSSRQEMLLTNVHLTRSKINWHRKSDNLIALARELNFSLDRFIFIDDSDMELAEVSRRLPDVLSIKMPNNLDDLKQILDHIWGFDHAVVMGREREVRYLSK